MRFRWGFAAVSLVCAVAARAGQDGPSFPTHHFPTDDSFHIGYRLGFLRSGSNFVSATLYEKLTDQATYTQIRHSLLAEFQPNRRLSFGGDFALASASLNAAGAEGVSRSGLGDQRFFGEYRVMDRPGASAGVALVAKFPGYTNPTLKELQAAGESRAALLGDAQTDLTVLGTGEIWPTLTFRTRLDTGFTLRTGGFASEFPFMLSAGFVNPRLDLDLKIKGYFALGSSGIAADEGLTALKAAMGNSDFVYAEKPWSIFLAGSGEFWLSPTFALNFDFSYSMLGRGAAHLANVGLGVTFREAHADRRTKKTFSEVDITTDQETGRFEGENQDQQDEEISR